MKEFKGYQTYNEAKEQIIKEIQEFLDFQNRLVGFGNPGNGIDLENEILERHSIDSLSGLSTATLIEEYNKLREG